MPARFRDELAKGLVITKGQERCLYVFPINEFSAITDRLRQAPVTEKAARDYMRVMFAGAHDEVRHQLRRDRDTRPVFAILTRVTEERQHSRNTLRGCAARRVDQDQKLHQVFVRRGAGRHGG